MPLYLFWTVIHSMHSTLGLQRKVTKWPCFWYLVFRTQFQHFLGVFRRSFFFFAVQLALASMITVTLISSLSVFSSQRTRRFRTRAKQGRTRGEQGLYFEMLRRINLWLFSWLSHRSREAQKLSVSWLRPAGSDPEVVCQKNSFLKVSVSLGGFGPSVAHGKHSVRRRCVQATKNKAETCSLLDAIGRRSCGRWREWV